MLSVFLGRNSSTTCDDACFRLLDVRLPLLFEGNSGPLMLKPEGSKYPIIRYLGFG